MIRIGITGGIGSGKTTVCHVFENLGIPVYNSDKSAKIIINYNEKAKKDIIKNFGRNIYQKSGSIDNERLSNIVFKDRFALKTLNSIVHPYVRKHFSDWIRIWKNAPYVIQEAAILFESKAYRFLDKIIMVYADKDIRINRIKKRDHFSEEKILQIMSNQMDEKKKCEKSDYVLINNEKELLLPQILKLHNTFILLT